MPSKAGNLFTLHFIVLLSSAIPIIVLFISLPALEIVFYRTLIAFLALGIFNYIKNYRIDLDFEDLSKIILSGILTSLYWFLLILSAKISNATVCLIGISTTSVWISFISPIIDKRKLNYFQIITGVIAILGILVITQSDFEHPYGLFTGILAGLFGAFVTIFNARLSKGFHHYVITFYQMIGAWLGTLLFFPIYYLYILDSEFVFLLPNGKDIFLLGTLVFVFSIFIYSQFIKLMRSVSPFIVTLSANLSPIYGILVALIFLGENERMGIAFYLGAALIVGSVILYPILEKRFAQRR